MCVSRFLPKDQRLGEITGGYLANAKSGKAITLSSGIVHRDSTLKRNYINLCGRVFKPHNSLDTVMYVFERNYIKVMCMLNLLPIDQKCGVSGFLLESNLTNVMHVIDFSSNVYSFGVMTVHTGRTHTNILNIEILLRNLGFTQEFILGRILTNVMNVVKILTNFYNLPPFQESILGITKSLVL